MQEKSRKRDRVFRRTLGELPFGRLWSLFLVSNLSLIFMSEPLLAQSPQRFGANRFFGLQPPNQMDFLSFLEGLEGDSLDQDPQLLLEKTQGAIAKIQGLLKEKPSESAKIRLLRRLADEYKELGMLEYQRELAVSERKAMLKSFENSDATLHGAMPSVALPSAKNDLKSSQATGQAVEILRELSEKLSSSKVKQEIDFELGLALLSLNSPDANLYLEQNAKQSSNTFKTSIAQLGLAEYLIANGKINEAAKRLLNVTAVKSNLTKVNKIIDYARFRLAWLRISATNQKSQLKPDDFSSMALASEDSLIQIASIPKSKDSAIKSFSPGFQDFQSSRYKFDLVKEARFDLAQIWALQGKDQIAQSFFTSINDERSLNFFWITYGYQLLKQGNFAEASLAYAKAANLSSPDRLTFMTENFLIYAYFKSQQHTALVRTLGTMFVTYSGPKGSWFLKYGTDAPLKKLIGEGLIQRLKGFESLYTIEALKSDENSQIDSALKILNLHLALIPKDPSLWRVKLVSADLLSKIGRNDEAIDRYLQAFKSKGVDTQSKVRAARNMVDLKLSMLGPSASIIQLESVRAALLSVKEKIQPDSVTVLLEVVDRYSGYQTKAVDVPKLRYLAAAQLLNIGHIDLGLERLDDLIKYHPGTQEATQAIRAFIEIQNMRQNYRGLVVWNSQFLKKQEYYPDLAIRSWVLGQLREAMWSYSQQLVVKKNRALAVKALQEFQEMFSGDSRADQALSQLLEIQIDNGFGSGAVLAANKLITNYPGSPYRKEALLKIAEVYIQQAQFEQAGQTMVTFSKQYPTDPKSPEMMLKAIAQYEFAENGDMVRLRAQEFAALFPKHPQALFVEEKSAEIFENNEDYKSAIEIYQTLAGRYERSHPEEAAFARVKAAVLTLNYLHESTGRELLSALEEQYLLQGGFQKAKEIIATQKLKDLKIKARNVLDVATLNSESYLSYERTHLSLLRQISELQKALVGLIPIGTTKTKSAAYLELGVIYDRIYRFYLTGISTGRFSIKDKKKYFKQREEVLSLARQQRLGSWQEGFRLSKLDPALFNLQRQLSSKLSKIAPGTYSDINEDFLDAKFLSQKVANE